MKACGAKREKVSRARAYRALHVAEESGFYSKGDEKSSEGVAERNEKIQFTF